MQDVDGLFLVAVLALAVLLVAFVGTAVYLAVVRRRGAEPGDRPHEPRGQPVRGSGSANAGTAGTEFRKSTGLEADRDVRVRIYSPEEYRRDLGGDPDLSREFVGAVKVLGESNGEWFDLPLDRTAGMLELQPRDYEKDEERGVLLLRRLPPGVPDSAGDAL